MQPFFEPFVVLLIAHLIGDFVLQTEQMALKKGNMLNWLVLHALELGAITWLLCWSPLVWPVVFVVFLTHLVFDWVKPRLPGHPLKWYIWDQAGHITTLLLCAYWMADRGGLGLEQMPLTRIVSLNILVLVAAYLVVGRPITVGVYLFLKPWQDELIRANGNGAAASPVTGLERSGVWVGSLERFLTLTCVLVGEYTPIAGIVIAKAILRYGEISQPHFRKRADYFILGTIGSVGLAIAVGACANWALRQIALQ